MSSGSQAPRAGSRFRRMMMVVLLGAAGAAMLQPVRSFDLWWHLATGRLMAAEGRIPTEDPFSFTSGGTPWLDHEWLFQVVAYAGYREAGWPFLVLGTLALGLATYLLLAACLIARTGDAPANWILLALSLAGIRFRLDFRPEMVSFLLLAALCAVLHSSGEPGRAFRAWLLFPLFTLWANCHPGAMLGAAVLILWLAGERIQNWLGGGGVLRDPRRDGVALASLFALLLNPGGIRLLAVPLEIRRIVTSGHAPNLEWLPPRPEDFGLFFGAVLAAGMVLVAAPVTVLARELIGAIREGKELPGGRRRGIGSALRSALLEIDWPPALALGLATCLALQQLRNISFFFALLPLALARPLAAWLVRRRIPSGVARWTGASALVLLTPLFLLGAPAWNEKAYLARVAPIEAVEFLERHRVGERLFNDVKFGGYLIWKRHPGQKVFIDGRNEIYDPLLEEVFEALGSWERWEGMLERHRIDAAMLRRGQMQAVVYPPDPPGAAPRREMRAFSASYFQASRWALVFWDDSSLIFVRRKDPAHAALLQREYRVVNPDDAPHLLSEIRHGRIRVQDALSEVDRKLVEDPLCRSALALRRQIESIHSGSPLLTSNVTRTSPR